MSAKRMHTPPVVTSASNVKSFNRAVTCGGSKFAKMLRAASISLTTRRSSLVKFRNCFSSRYARTPMTIMEPATESCVNQRTPVAVVMTPTNTASVAKRKGSTKTKGSLTVMTLRHARTIVSTATRKDTCTDFSLGSSMYAIEIPCKVTLASPNTRKRVANHGSRSSPIPDIVTTVMQNATSSIENRSRSSQSSAPSMAVRTASTQPTGSRINRDIRAAWRACAV
mmetsp:Transcript_30545/g.70435  ORF Transcript_30545/g.70435 Transcript_30545/m.70435 type:complete len:225 (+) Transcript_30545:1522-2196(+)